jgi:hypothetical protein
MTKPKSSTLFHFTKSLDILKNILDKGFFPRYSLEDISWLVEEKRVAYPMVCFCDIPISRLTEHVDFYGYYGLGMTRDWGLVNGLNPITYLSYTSPLAESLRKSTRTIMRAKAKENKPEYLVDLRRILAFSKPLTGTIVINGKPVEKEFYQESEWRFLATTADIPEFLLEAKYSKPDELSNRNEKAASLCPLKFSPPDIKYIFVKSDTDIPDLVNYINVALDRYPSAQLKVLATRILSLEQIEKDV